MNFTIVKVNGLGLAVPRIYKSFKIFIVYSHPNERYPDVQKTNH